MAGKTTLRYRQTVAFSGYLPATVWPGRSGGPAPSGTQDIWPSGSSTMPLNSGPAALGWAIEGLRRRLALMIAPRAAAACRANFPSRQNVRLPKAFHPATHH